MPLPNPNEVKVLGQAAIELVRICRAKDCAVVRFHVLDDTGRTLVTSSEMRLNLGAVVVFTKTIENDLKNVQRPGGH